MVHIGESHKVTNRSLILIQYQRIAIAEVRKMLLFDCQWDNGWLMSDHHPSSIRFYTLYQEFMEA